MKTKNLLLAGLAVFAMTACNNDIESIDNNDLPLEKNASMQLNFSFPKSSETRATGDRVPGSEFEYGVSTVTAILEYSGTNKRLVVQGLTIEGEPNANGVITAKTGTFQVSTGTISKIYAIVNNNDATVSAGTDLSKLLVAADPFSLPSNSLDYLRETIAEDGNFLMSGISEAPVTINAGETKTGTISVDRVCAKLEEKTEKTTPYELTDPTVVSKDGKAISIRIIGHTYANLNANSYVFKNPDGSWWSQNDIIQAYSAEKTEADYCWKEKESTYCLENITGAGKDSWDRGKATHALYKGQVYLEDTQIEGKFYVKANFDGNILYPNWATLKTDYSGLPATEDELTAEIMEGFGIKQYNGGVCYYSAPILTNGTTADIVRNNWYQLSVGAIKDLGTPTPVPTVDPEDAYLSLTVNIMPWTIQANDYTLE